MEPRDFDFDVRKEALRQAIQVVDGAPSSPERIIELAETFRRFLAAEQTIEAEQSVPPAYRG